MPELPEVETVKSTLEKIYLNKSFSSVEVRYSKMLDNIEKDSFENILLNQTITSFDRYGKFIIINLSNGTLIIHLRMEGKFKFEKSLIDKHSHIIFTFTDDSILIYHDVRKFGKMWYFDKSIDIRKVYPLNKLGLEPFAIKDGNYLYSKLAKIKKPIKGALLDQSILCGIGNIYADEILFASKINPTRLANSLSIENCNDIIINASNILNKAIIYGGSTIKNFQSSHGVDGKFQTQLNVYGKQNCQCPNCKGLIVKEFVCKRGTHYCPNCQK